MPGTTATDVPVAAVQLPQPVGAFDSDKQALAAGDSFISEAPVQPAPPITASLNDDAERIARIRDEQVRDEQGRVERERIERERLERDTAHQAARDASKASEAAAARASTRARSVTPRKDRRAARKDPVAEDARQRNDSFFSESDFRDERR